VSFAGNTASGDDVQAYVKATYHHGTVPAVFVKGSLLGGCDATVAADQSGKLQSLLA
jgi:glutaredoxin 3